MQADAANAVQLVARRRVCSGTGASRLCGACACTQRLSHKTRRRRGFAPRTQIQIRTQTQTQRRHRRGQGVTATWLAGSLRSRRGISCGDCAHETRSRRCIASREPKARVATGMSVRSGRIVVRHEREVFPLVSAGTGQDGTGQGSCVVDVSGCYRQRTVMYAACCGNTDTRVHCRTPWRDAFRGCISRGTMGGVKEATSRTPWRCRSMCRQCPSPARASARRSALAPAAPADRQ